MEILELDGGAVIVSHLGAVAHVRPSLVKARAAAQDLWTGKETAKNQDAWQFTLPGAERYSHPTKSGAILHCRKDLESGMAAQIGNDHLLPDDKVFLARIIGRRARASWLLPVAGDFLLRPGDAWVRLAYYWHGQGWQTVAAGAGSFYLETWGRGNYSGSLDPVLPGSDRLTDSGLTTLGAFWIFRNNEPKAGGGVAVEVPCRVWSLPE